MKNICQKFFQRLAEILTGSADVNLEAMLEVSVDGSKPRGTCHKAEVGSTETQRARLTWIVEASAGTVEGFKEAMGRALARFHHMAFNDGEAGGKTPILSQQRASELLEESWSESIEDALRHLIAAKKEGRTKRTMTYVVSDPVEGGGMFGGQSLRFSVTMSTENQEVVSTFLSFISEAGLTVQSKDEYAAIAAQEKTAETAEKAAKKLERDKVRIIRALETLKKARASDESLLVQTIKGRLSDLQDLQALAV